MVFSLHDMSKYMVVMVFSFNWAIVRIFDFTIAGLLLRLLLLHAWSKYNVKISDLVLGGVIYSHVYMGQAMTKKSEMGYDCRSKATNYII